MIERRRFIGGLGAAAALGGCAAFSKRRQFLGGVEIDEDMTIAEALLASPDHGEFLAGLDRSGAMERLDGFGPFTVFAPSDAALSMTRPRQLAEQIIAGADQTLLLNHVVAARVTSEELRDGAAAIGRYTLLIAESGAVLRIAKTTPLRILDERDRASAMVETDVRLSNGIIHSIDNALASAREKAPSES